MSLLDLIFGCDHENTSRVFTLGRRPNRRSYIVCLRCGKEFNYDLSEMRVVKEVKPERKLAPVIEIGEFRRIARSK